MQESDWWRQNAVSAFTQRMGLYVIWPLQSSACCSKVESSQPYTLKDEELGDWQQLTKGQLKAGVLVSTLQGDGRYDSNMSIGFTYSGGHA